MPRWKAPTTQSESVISILNNTNEVQALEQYTTKDGVGLDCHNKKERFRPDQFNFRASRAILPGQEIQADVVRGKKQCNVIWVKSESLENIFIIWSANLAVKKYNFENSRNRPQTQTVSINADYGQVANVDIVNRYRNCSAFPDGCSKTKLKGAQYSWHSESSAGPMHHITQMKNSSSTY